MGGRWKLTCPREVDRDRAGVRSRPAGLVRSSVSLEASAKKPKRARFVRDGHLILKLERVLTESKRVKSVCVEDEYEYESRCH